MAKIYDAITAILEGRSVLDAINGLLEKVEIGKRTKHSVPGTSRLQTQRVGRSAVTRGFASKLPALKVGKTKVSRGYY